MRPAIYPLNPVWTKFQNPPANEKSQRDFIIQPGVDAMPSWLRWVLNQKMESTLKDLNRCARNGDAICWGWKISWGRLTQGSACRATRADGWNPAGIRRSRTAAAPGEPEGKAHIIHIVFGGIPARFHGRRDQCQDRPTCRSRKYSLRGLSSVI